MKFWIFNIETDKLIYLTSDIFVNHRRYNAFFYIIFWL